MKALRNLIVGVALIALPTGVIAVSPGEQPLPDLKEIFPKIVARSRQESENDRSFECRYVFVRSKVTDYRNADGEIKKHEAKTSTNNPALKRSAARRKPQPAPVRPPEKAKAAANTNSIVRGKQFDQDEFLLNPDMVRRFDFTLTGRAALSGRSMLIVEFQPAKGKLPERTLKDKFLNKAAGRVWLDEADYTIVKVAIQLTDRINVFGGLVGAIRKFTYGFERERTTDGLWFTRDEQWHLEGREVLAERIVDFHAERTGVRKAD